MGADVLERIFDNARRYPEHKAVVEPNREITYREFVSLICRIAAQIRKFSQPHPKVLIHLPQGIEAYASMFAAMMAGGYYSPTNIKAPAHRQQAVFSMFEPDVIVSASTYLETFDSLDVAGMRIVDVNSRGSTGEICNPEKPHELAYVIFTSGSTGEPKGVMISRRSLAHYARWITDAMSVTHLDRWPQHPNIAFDLSVMDIYGALCSAATLYPMIDERDRLLPARFIHRNQLTIWDSVPSVLDVMSKDRRMNIESLKSLRLMTFCGEPLFRSHLETIFSAGPNIVVHNTYGPTEATVSCTLVRLNRDNYIDNCRSSVALGESIPGMELNLIGGAHKDEGEIVLSGEQLSFGYWRQAELTKNHFQDLQIDDIERRVYKTGDWAERINGKLFFVARIDTQVKIRGHRVELEAIDAAVRKVGITKCCTVLSNDRLVCFLERDGCPGVSELQAKLSEVLMEYEVPSFFPQVDKFPRNANDKIDRGALLKWADEMEAEDLDVLREGL